MSEPRHRGRGRARYEEIKAHVLDGTYGAGTSRPSTRACAAERGLSRTTVSIVYEQLAAEGFIETRPGASCRVAAGAMSSRGDLRLRRALQSYLARARGISCSPDQMVIVNALDLCARLLLNPGDKVVAWAKK